MERFSEVAKIEEETAQKQLELKKLQVKSTNEVAVANIQAKVHLRVERDRRKAELMMQKSKQDHEFRMAELQTRNPTHTPGPRPTWLTGPQGGTSTAMGSQFTSQFAFSDDPNLNLSSAASSNSAAGALLDFDFGCVMGGQV
jgi:hypothetical protein